MSSVYARAIAPNTGLKTNDSGMQTAMMTIAARTAVLGARSPDARGRSRLIGWTRSLSMSARSLMRYMALDNRQKITNAIALCKRRGRSNNRPSKKMPANTKEFLAHCLGRIVLTSLLSTLVPRYPGCAHHMRVSTDGQERCVTDSVSRLVTLAALPLSAP